MIREAPPKISIPTERKVIRIAGPKSGPPPPRKVIVQKMPEISEKAQSIVIERWLAPKILPRRVVLEGSPLVSQEHAKVRNEIHECEYPNVVVDKKVTTMGVSQVDPNEVVE